MSIRRRMRIRYLRYLAAHTRMGYAKSGRNHARLARRLGSGHTFRPQLLAATSRARPWTPKPTPRSKPARSPSATRTGTSRSTTARIGPDVIDIAKLYGETGMFTYDPGFTSTASCESKITYIDGDEGVLLYRGYPIEQLAEHGDFLETCYLLLYGELPTAGAEGRLRLPRHAPHDGARADEPVLPGLPPRRASDGGDDRLRRRAVGLLSRLHRHHRSAPAHDRLDPPDRQDADDRRDGLQIFDRPAVRLSEERPRLRRELPAHVLRGAGRGVQAEPGAGARDGPHLHPARRPRAERLDLDGAARRLVRRQPVRLHRRRHRLPVGPGAWRRQRGGAQHAARDRHGRPHPGIHQARQGQERSASA